MRRRVGGVFGVALALLPGLGDAQANDLKPKVFRNWIAGCDNLRQCTALSLPGDTDGGVAYLKLERTGDPLANVSLSLNLRDENLKPEFPVRLFLDDAPFPSAERTFKGSSLDGEVATIGLSEADIEALLAATRKSTELRLALGGRIFKVSLAGAVAAMIWIDERQSRLGTVTALVRKGEAPASRVPAAPKALPVITARSTSHLPKVDDRTAKALTDGVRKLLKPDDCAGPDAAVPGTDHVYPLDATRKLVALHCRTGSYNVAASYWIVSGNSAAAAKPVVFPAQSDNELVNSEYDPKTGQLGYYSKGRGVGDCGSAGNYAWTGSRFVLTVLTIMDTCGGIPADDWLSLFHSEVKVAK